jgi:3-methyladenine DNA glycosylase AlkD
MRHSIDGCDRQVNTGCRMKCDVSLSDHLRARLEKQADPNRAPAMQAYMKSPMPFLGVGTPERRRVTKLLFAPLIYGDPAAWRADVLQIWREARYREELYAAIDLAGIRPARPFQRMEALPLYREMIISGNWWDTTDAIAPHRLFDILMAERDAMSRVLLAWASDDNLWIRRSAILCQMLAKDAMDIPLLEACIAPSLDSKEFFLRKAIGWVLRHYARTDPDYVRGYVAANAQRLSSLSKREALKHLD